MFAGPHSTDTTYDSYKSFAEDFYCPGDELGSAIASLQAAELWVVKKFSSAQLTATGVITNLPIPPEILAEFNDAFPKNRKICLERVP